MSIRKTISFLGMLISLLSFVNTSSLSQEQKEINIPELEDKIVAEIKESGIGDRFFINDIKPISNIFSGYRATLIMGPSRFSTNDSSIYYTQEFPGDPTTWKLPAYFTMSNDKDGNPKDIFYSRYVIHRYNGKVVLENGYRFIGEGDKYNRLTFSLFDEGYVYLRGKGKVILPNGKIIKLGGGK